MMVPARGVYGHDDKANGAVRPARRSHETKESSWPGGPPETMKINAAGAYTTHPSPPDQASNWTMLLYGHPFPPSRQQ